jgi:AcrR family transcriptional regulator
MRARWNRGQDTVIRLVEVAEQLFASRGFLGVSITELLVASKVTRPVLYYHFGSKEGLYLAVTRKVIREYAASLKLAASEGATAVERIHRVCRAHVTARREWALIGVPAGVAPEGETTRDDGNGPPESVADLVEKLVVEGITRGEIAVCNASAAALALVGAAEAVIARCPICTSDSPQDRVDEVVDLVLRGLTPQVAS